jgi:polar amino acid transport system substrate-binding protein
MLDRRIFSAAALAGVGLAGATRMAQAQGSAPAKVSNSSTWDSIIKRGVLRVGGPLGEPYYYRDIASGKTGDDQWIGIGPALGRLIAEAMGVKFHVIETSWATAPAGLQADEFDIVFAFDMTPKRALAVDFLPTQWFWYPLGALVRDGIKVVNWEDLNKPDIRIGVNLGATPDAFATKNLPKAQIMRFNKVDENIAAFQAGRTDVVMLVATGTDLFAQRLKKGTSVVPKPVNWYAANSGIRLETDQRWRNYLTLTAQYYYNTGKITELYDDFIRARGLDPSKLSPIVRES